MLVVDDQSPDGTGDARRRTGAPASGPHRGAAPHEEPRARAVVRRRPEARDSRTRGRHLPDGRRPVARPGAAAPAHRGREPRRRRDRVALCSRRRDRELAEAASAAQPVRERVHPDRSRAWRRTTARAATGAGGATRWPRCRSIGSSPTAIRSSSRCCSWRRRRGLKVVEVPITFVERRLGESKLSRAVIVESAVMPWRLVATPALPRSRPR